MTASGKRKVLLLQPPITVKREDAATFGCFPPLGLAYLAAVLEEEGVEIEIADLLAEGGGRTSSKADGTVTLGLPPEKIRRRLVDSSPSVVGISDNFTSFSPDCLRVAGLVRRTLPEALVVMGGAHASAEPHALLSTGVVDVVVVGEGEYTFRDLVRAVLSGRWEKARRLPGTVWAVGGEVLDNGSRPPIEDLDAIPFPAYHLLPMDRYLWQRAGNFAVVLRRPVAHMITTRGCPYRCIFCSTSHHFKKFRQRSPENVLAEIRLLRERWGIQEFHFHDDSFAADPERVRSLCERIVAEGIDLRWQVSQGINSHRLDEDLLEVMQRSGMYRVGFPIESGCPQTLRFIRKPLRLERVKSLIEKCNRLGIYCFGCFMIGFPEETGEQLQETIDFILDSGLDYAKISIVQPLAGSELQSVYQQHNLLKGVSQAGSSYHHTSYDTLHFTASELNRIREETNRAFARRRVARLLSPEGVRRYILPKLRSWEGVRYFARVGLLALRGY